MKGPTAVTTHPPEGQVWPGGSLTLWSAFSTLSGGHGEPLTDGHSPPWSCFQVSLFLSTSWCFLSISRECVRKCFSSRVASTNTWKSFLMVFTKGSCLFLMSGLPWPTTVLWYQVSQPRSRAYIVSGQNHSPFYTRCSGKAART